MCNTWDVDGLLVAITNRLFMEWVTYWNLKADYEEEAYKRATRKAKQRG